MAKEKNTKEKSLEKMTSKELRELALTIPEITGAHGMNKPELISDIKKARGIEEKVTKKKDSSIRELKTKINELKNKRNEAVEAKDSKKVAILRKRINKLKKRIRRAA